MTRERLTRELKLDIQIFANCKGIKIKDEDAQERASSYVEQLSANVCMSKIKIISTNVEKIDMTEYYYEITFKTHIMFKNEFSFSDTIFMIVSRKDGE